MKLRKGTEIRDPFGPPFSSFLENTPLQHPLLPVPFSSQGTMSDTLRPRSSKSSSHHDTGRLPRFWVAGNPGVPWASPRQRIRCSSGRKVSGREPLVRDQRT